MDWLFLKKQKCYIHWGRKHKAHNLIFISKILSGLTPDYLRDLLRPCILPEATYSLRNHYDFTFYCFSGLNYIIHEKITFNHYNLRNSAPLYPCLHMNVALLIYNQIINESKLKFKNWYKFGDRKNNMAVNPSQVVSQKWEWWFYDSF